MPRKKKSGSAAWVDPDDAPELTDKFFDRAEIRQGDQDCPPRPSAAAEPEAGGEAPPRCRRARGLPQDRRRLADADQRRFAQGEEAEASVARTRKAS